jgi:hypothetical protein
VERPDITLVTHIRKLLANIVCESILLACQSCDRKDRCNVPRLHIGDFTIRLIFCLSRKDKANAERGQPYGGALRIT